MGSRVSKLARDQRRLAAFVLAEAFRYRSGVSPCSTVGINSVTVGWICTAREMVVYGRFAYITSSSPWSIPSGAYRSPRRSTIWLWWSCQSHTDIPSFFLTIALDMQGFVDFRAALKKHRPDVKVSYKIVITSRRGGPADCTIAATAGELHLLLWDRRSDADISVDGDRELLARLREGVQTRWS